MENGFGFMGINRRPFFDKKILLVFFTLLFFQSFSAHAYIGPGAGIAFAGSTFVFLLAFFAMILTIFLLPFKILKRKVFKKKRVGIAKTGRVIILGLDGFDPNIVKLLMLKGKLKNLKQLSEEGCFNNLSTTFPSISPVAWSTFQTGVNPGAHNIFDFLTRNKQWYIPDLSSIRIDPPKKHLSIGRWRFPLGKQHIRMLRKSKPFWKILGEHGIFSNVLRVPITCPPEAYFGNLLAGMCVPDLRGTQGIFSFYSTCIKSRENITGGEQIEVKREGNTIKSYLTGPAHPYLKAQKKLKVPFTVKICSSEEALLSICGKKIDLKLGKFSDWIELEFKFGICMKIVGICRFYLKSTQPELELYVSPININPAKPIFPISHPSFFSIYLAKLNGLFGTQGLMEDTWARNEHVLNDKSFLEQAYLTHQEREKMFFSMMDKTREGLCVCVFDAPDRIQHIFWRYLDASHPSPLEDAGKFRNTIYEMYERMDDLVGLAREKIKEKDVLIVLSDHGFSSFRRCINLNSWLLKEGLLILKNDTDLGKDFFEGVDWKKSKAFAVGLSGIYLNRAGREKEGILSDAETKSLKIEMVKNLRNLKDPMTGENAIRNVYDTQEIYKGAYVDEAPDLIVGYAPGYRVSWESVTGKIEPKIFGDNKKAWSGDHSIDSLCVPGVFFCNRKISRTAPDMLDIAPSVLDLFGVEIPAHMEGRSLF